MSTPLRSAAPRKTLVVLLALRAQVEGAGSIVTTRKQVEGAAAYVKAWDGPVRIWMEPTDEPTTDLDRFSVRLADLPYQQLTASFDDAPARHLEDAAVVLCATSYRQNHIPDVCRALGVPAVNTSEYTLTTRLQIVNARDESRLRRVKSSIWEIRQEARQRRAIRHSVGLQANGPPTYDTYASLVRFPFLYFDSRTTRDMMIADADLEARLASRPFDQGGPLRLVFSGRLVTMKGVQHLPAVAGALAARGVSFTLDIFGDGPLRASLEADIAARGLGERVRLRGAVPFQTELVPFVKTHADLFICPHVQGDPACTYLETMSCGVPILGFGNEMLQGLLARVPGAGEHTPMADADALGDAIARWARDRERCAQASRAAIRFAREHSFEDTFERRVAHLRSVADAFAGTNPGMRMS